MSARRWFTGALLAAGLAAGAASAARAQIVARVGGELAGRVGDTLEVPITVDLRAAPGVRLGSYRMDVRFDGGVLQYWGLAAGTFATPLVNSDSAFVYGPARLRLTAIQPSGAEGEVTLVVVRFLVVSDTASSSPVTVDFDEMSAAGTFDNLLPSLSVVNGAFCRATGTWGDVDLDGRANSRDALIALSKVVGLPLDTTRLDTLWVDSVAHTQTTVLMRPGLADVDGSGSVTSRDALIIVSHAVGLPVTGFRIGLPAAAGGCASGIGITLSVWPDTLELQTGQQAPIAVTARDGSGQPAATSGATLTSSNTAVAGVFSGGLFGVEARDPGIAVLTVRLGAGASASMVVRVIAHRTRWSVDVQRARGSEWGVPLQTGSQAFPFAFIGQALEVARNGDTISVAPGIYEEEVSWSGVSVTIIGDSLDRPVIDPRASPYYDAYSTKALDLQGGPGAPLVLRNLRMVGGAVNVQAHDLVARNISVEAPGTQDAFMAVSIPLPQLGAPAGVQRVPGTPYVGGNLLLDGIEILGYVQVGIGAIYGDTVVVRNSSVTRDSLGSTSCSEGPTSFTYAGIGVYVETGGYTEISGNTVHNTTCSGIRALQLLGRTLIHGNRVSGAGAGGITVGGDTIELDHNVVREIRAPIEGYQTVGIQITPEGPARLVTSLGDSIVNTGQRGFAMDSTVVGRLDSLVVDSTGQDGMGGSSGVESYNGRVTVRHSRISGTGAGGAGVQAWGNSAVLESRHNVFLRTGGPALLTTQYGGGGAYAPPAAGPAMAGGADAGGPDTLISVGDSMSLSYSGAVRAENGVYLLVDSATVDSVTNGHAISASDVHSVEIRDSRVADVQYSGVYVSGADSVRLERTVVRRFGADPGVFLSNVQGAASVLGSTIDSGASNGLFFYGYTDNVRLAVDSSRIAHNAQNGIWVYCQYCVDSGTVRRSTITGNSIGIRSEGNSGGVHLLARRNTIAGNSVGGVMDSAFVYGVTVAADTNYWGDPDGPRCAGGVTGCAASVAGDYVLTPGVTFADWLAAPPTDAMPAPPVLRLAAPRPVSAAPAEVASRAASDFAARGRPSRVAARQAIAPAAGVPRFASQTSRPRAGWRRGQSQRPAQARPQP